MREVLVDFARRRKAAKRGGAMQRVSLGEGEGNGERVCDSAVAHPLVLTLNGLVRLYDAEGKPAEAAKYRALLNDSVLTAASTGSSSQPHR